MAKHVRPSDMRAQTTQTTGMSRAEAIRAGSVWSGTVTTQPGMTSGWHHHDGHETVIYVVEGTFRFETGPGGRTVMEGSAGDFIYVGPREIHREINPGSTPCLAVIVRAGSGEIVVNVDGPEP